MRRATRLEVTLRRKTKTLEPKQIYEIFKYRSIEGK